MEKQPQSSEQSVQIKASDEKLKGEYANLMRVHHTKEEFVMDFINLFEQFGTLNARIIVSPGHMKRMITALAENIARYETHFGSVEPSEAPSHKIGFESKE